MITTPLAVRLGLTTPTMDMNKDRDGGAMEYGVTVQHKGGTPQIRSHPVVEMTYPTRETKFG
jgi:hypothetical protein